jgi:hypothetical protein
MIEELPWLCGLTARLHMSADTGRSVDAHLSADVKVAFRRPAS